MKFTTGIVTCLFIFTQSLLACSESTTVTKAARSDEERADSLAAINTYCNSRFDYCLEYPANILRPQPESENGDGRLFSDEHGNEVMRVWGSRNEDMEGETVLLEQQYRDDLDRWNNEAEHKSITYSKLGKAFFVISGFDSSRIFYQKTILKPEGFCTAFLRYDSKDRSTYDSISSRIFQSFH